MSPPQTRPEASRLVPALACATGIAVLVAAAGCGTSSSKRPDPQPAAERYVTSRIDREMRHVGPLLRRTAGTQPDVFVYCRAAGAKTSLCQATVTSSATHEPIAGQRWRVQSDASGGVVSAQALDVQLVPLGSLAQRLAADRAGRHRNTPAPKPRPLATLGLSALKVAFPPTRTYACVADGTGKLLFEGVITAPKSVRVRAPRLLVNLGNSNLSVHVNGRIFRIPASPYGLAIGPGRVSYLPKGKRPCNR